MLLPLLHSHPSLPPKPLTDQSHPPFFFFFSASPLPKTLNSHKPKTSKFLIRSSSTSTSTTTKTAETLPKSAIQRIAEKLRSLGYTDEISDGTVNSNLEPETKRGHGKDSVGEIFIPLPKQLPKYRVGHTIDPSWSTPENPVPEPGSGRAISRYHALKNMVEKDKEKRLSREKEKEEKVPTLAELSLSEEELRRLRAIGLKVRKKLKIGKAGITEGIVNGIHERWRHAEVVKIACEDLCKLNMKRTHELLERKTGGLVVWRSGSSIILYRGDNYKYPYFLVGNDSTNDTSHKASADSHMDYARNDRQESYSSSMNNVNSAGINVSKELAHSSIIRGVGSPDKVRFQLPGEAQLAEEADHLLDGLGPRFTDWWGYEPLPVDADLLPAVVPGYKRPFRLLPYGVEPKLTNDEMTTLRRLGRPLPCHFALGRNRNLQGLAASIVKLWEKCEIAKIAIKRGVQNTNSVLMAEELKRLTGGALLSRDREFITFYRGKDFLPPAVSHAIEERRKHGLHVEKQRTDCGASFIATEGPELRVRTSKHASKDILDATDNHRKKFLSERRKLRITEAAIKKTNTNLSIALEKKERAEKLLAELEMVETPQEPEIDKEGITEEERYMLKKVGLRMKPFLLLGRRGVFDGTVENMHLHWKYRELVKILSNERSIEDVHEVARILETESGGILVAVERVNRGYVIIVYRGKNYMRPATLRPKTLLNKREAMRRSLEAQRRQSLKLHILKLTRNIDDLKVQLAKDREPDSKESIDESNIQLVNERLRVGSTSTSSNYGMETSINRVEDKQIDFSSKYEDESDQSEPESSSESVETGVSTYINNECGNVDFISIPDHYGTDTSIDRVEYMQQDRQIDFSSKYEDESDQSEPESSSESVETGVSTDINNECGIDRVEFMQQDKQIDFSSKYEDESDQSEPESSSESVETGVSTDINIECGNVDFISTPDYYVSQGQTTCSTSAIVNTGPHVSVNETMESLVQPAENKIEPSFRGVVEYGSSGIPVRAVPLSNKERLLLRKEALKMRSRPVLAIGRSNIVTGVAKAIKIHFRKYPLAIVNVKGRAKGTSVQEVIFKLEQATGAVLVSQEPSKVILYRGWGAGVELSHGGRKNARETSVARGGQSQPALSPELMAAIKLECGLQSNQEEETTL